MGAGGGGIALITLCPLFYAHALAVYVFVNINCDADRRKRHYSESKLR